MAKRGQSLRFSGEAIWLAGQTQVRRFLVARLKFSIARIYDVLFARRKSKYRGLPHEGDFDAAP